MSLRVRQIRYTSATIKRIGSQVNDQASILSRNVNPNGTIHVPGARRGPLRAAACASNISWAPSPLRGELLHELHALVGRELPPNLRARAVLDHHDVGREVVLATDQARSDAIHVDGNTLALELAYPL